MALKAAIPSATSFFPGAFAARSSGATYTQPNTVATTNWRLLLSHNDYELAAGWMDGIFCSFPFFSVLLSLFLYSFSACPFLGWTACCLVVEG